MGTTVEFAPQKSEQHRTKKQSTDVPEDILKAVRLVPQDPVHCMERQIVDVPAPQSQEVVKILPQMPVNRTEKQIVDVSGPKLVSGAKPGSRDLRAAEQ